MYRKGPESWLQRQQQQTNKGRERKRNNSLWFAAAVAALVINYVRESPKQEHNRQRESLWNKS